jgi:hypothetical protein
VARNKFVRLVNRSTQPLDCMWDGVPFVVKPGYREDVRPIMDPNDPDVPLLDRQKRPRTETVYVPLDDRGRDLPLDAEPEGQLVEYAEAEGAIRQHPIMGSADPNSINARDTDYLLAVAAWGDDVSHIEQSDAIELLDRSLLGEDRQNISVRQVAGARRAPRPSDVTDKKIAANKKRDRMLRRSDVVDPSLVNPTGLEMRGVVNPGEAR